MQPLPSHIEQRHHGHSVHDSDRFAQENHRVRCARDILYPSDVGKILNTGKTLLQLFGKVGNILIVLPARGGFLGISDPLWRQCVDQQIVRAASQLVLVLHVPCVAQAHVGANIGSSQVKHVGDGALEQFNVRCCTSALGGVIGIHIKGHAVNTVLHDPIGQGSHAAFLAFLNARLVGIGMADNADRRDGQAHAELNRAGLDILLVAAILQKRCCQKCGHPNTF